MNNQSYKFGYSKSKVKLELKLYAHLSWKLNFVVSEASFTKYTLNYPPIVGGAQIKFKSQSN